MQAQPIPVRNSDNVVRLLCLVGAARWQEREANPAFWAFADTYFGEATSKLLPRERDLPEKVFIKIEDMCKKALVGTPFGERLYGAGHPYNELPLDIIIDLAIRESLDLWKRGVKRFPERCSYDYLYGSWLFSCFYHLRNLEKNGVEPSREALLRVLGSKTEEITSGNGGAEMTKRAVEAEIVEEHVEGKLVAVRYEEVPVCDGTVAAAVANDGNTYFSPRWVSEAVLEMDWGSQFTKIKKDPVLKSCVVEITTQVSGQARTMTMLPIDMLAGWLFTIKKVPNEVIQERLNRFRRDAFRILDEWARGKVGNVSIPRQTSSPDALAALRVEKAKKIAVETAALRMELMLRAEKELEFVLPKETKQVLFGKAMEEIYGTALPEIFPRAIDPMYSATDIGNECGVSPQKIGKIANEHGLKSPQGESGEYGTWIRTKSPHSSKEVISFVYNECGREWFLNFFGILAKAQ